MLYQPSHIVAAGALVLVGLGCFTNTLPLGHDTTAGEIGADAAPAPLPLELPNPAFTNWNAPLDLPGDIRLSPEPLQPRTPFLAPRDVENLAATRPVASSAPPVRGVLRQIVDGDKEPMAESMVILPEKSQWVQVDLQGEYELHAVVFWLNHASEYVPRGVIVQVANDPDFDAGVVTLFNNDHTNVAGHGRGDHLHYIDSYQGKLVPAHGVTTRYVRLHTAGNASDDTNHFTEVEAWGVRRRDSE